MVDQRLSIAVSAFQNETTIETPEEPGLKDHVWYKLPCSKVVVPLPLPSRNGE